MGKIARENRSRTPMHVHRTIARLKTDHWPIVCVTLRTGNRTWVSQQEGMIAIAHLLARDYPNAALIVDGFSRLHGQSAMPPAQQEQIIHQELALVQAMRKALGGGLNIQTTIGEPIVHSMVYTQIIDCYLAHHGSLQHKIGWLSNAPGLVHATAWCCRLRSFGNLHCRCAQEHRSPSICLHPWFATLPGQRGWPTIAGWTTWTTMRWMRQLFMEY